MTRYLIIIIFTVVTLVSTYACASGKQLDENSDNNIVLLLNNMELIGEIKKPPYWIKLYKLRDFGECASLPASCPKESIYVAISTFDETPKQKVYILPKSYGWRFVNWTETQVEEQPNSFVSFKMMEKTISRTPEKGWWLEDAHIVRVNIFKATID